MMKQVQYLIVIIILLCVNVFAQNLDLEGFEDAFPPDGWEVYSVIDDWVQDSGNPYNGDNSAAIYCASYNEAWLISPAIDLSTVTDPFLNYYEFVVQYESLDGEHYVLISTDYDGLGDPYAIGTSWTELRMGIQNYFNWDSIGIDLSSYMGDIVYIAFQYIGNDDGVECGTTWYIDDVEVDDFCTGGEPTPDCVTLTAPPNGATLNPNFGSLSWNPIGPPATMQLLYFGSDGGGTITPTNRYNGIEYSEYTGGVGFSALTANTTYYWQVIPANCSQTAFGCPIWSFTTNDGEENYGGGDTTQGGYFWANSTALASGAPSQPIYNWIDISGTGIDSINTTADDETIGPLPLGFTFNFFGVDYTQFYINSNGFITFGSTAGQTNFPFPIPSLNTPNNLIAGFWKNLDPTASVTGKHLYYGSNAGDMVITFENYPQWGGDADGWITFQVIIKPSGNVKIQYNNSGTSFNLNDGAVGIENSDGTKGILYRYRQYGGAIFSSPLALEFGVSSGALPVELTALTASVKDGAVNLNWETATEVNNYGFEVQRSEFSQASEFRTLGFVVGNGNSNSPKNYSFVDDNVVAGKSAFQTGRYSYRLKQIDNDGMFEYSKIIEVDLGTPSEYKLSQNYPNPFNPSTVISFSVPIISHVSLKVYDVLGNEVATLVNEEKPAGVYDVEFNAAGLTSGIYFYKLQAGNFVETKKMMLLK